MLYLKTIHVPYTKKLLLNNSIRFEKLLLKIEIYFPENKSKKIRKISGRNWKICEDASINTISRNKRALDRKLPYYSKYSNFYLTIAEILLGFKNHWNTFSITFFIKKEMNGSQVE